MPRNHLTSDCLEMDMSPSYRPSDLSRDGSLDSRRSSPRSRSFTSDDESLKHLTHEEKDVILFFEETIDSLEDDLEEEALCDSGIHCHSPRSLEESTSSHSEPEDIIDLVKPIPEDQEGKCLRHMAQVAESENIKKEEVPSLESKKETADSISLPDSTVPESTLPLAPPLPASTPPLPASAPPLDASAPPPPASAPPLPASPPMSPQKESSSPPAEHPKLLHSVPTPLVIAQRISERWAGNEGPSPTSTSVEGRFSGWKTRTFASPSSQNGEHSPWHRHALASQTVPKIHRFPSNISVTNSAGKDFNKTISKAAVNVQERKAQVLANINGVAFLGPGEAEDRLQRNELTDHRRSLLPEQAACDALSKLSVVKEAPDPEKGRQTSIDQCSKAVQTEQATTLPNGYQSIHEALKSEPSPFVSSGKTITFRPDSALPNKITRQNVAKSLYEHRQPDIGQDVRRRSGSLPRAVGFRPQGITVQFAGRGSTEEARREALRKLGLLKETL
ncbi:proline and serine-rich protein 2 [Dromiciops gliroides]|uniref:proline and serine-rich protein 2 n=1 Tax=Dromiciops gliroides TaxID=33562 RepID=UPI001CC7735F|nr:proline and serine-rich protein 2 [Dromiciops gliroides]XP_043822534.1 proline and serine-rich protein 2 [Dromiciops gliroides]